MGRHVLLALALALLSAAPATAETLDNEAVLALSQAGLSEEAILLKISLSDADFDVSTPALIALSKAGVPTNVIAAMLRRSADGAEPATGSAAQFPAGPIPEDAAQFTDYPDGVYLIEGSGDDRVLTRLAPTLVTGNKASNLLGHTLTGGLAPMKFKARLDGPRSSLAIAPGAPVFLVKSAPDAPDTGDAEAALDIIPPAASLILVRLDPKQQHRQITIGRYSGTQALAGVDPDDTVPLDIERLGTGVYRLRALQAVCPGEYALAHLLPLGNGLGATKLAKVDTLLFDFSVSPAPQAEGCEP